MNSSFTSLNDTNTTQTHEDQRKILETMLTTNQNFLSNFSEREVIGEGGFGTVYRGICLEDKQSYAIKELKWKSGINPSKKKQQKAINKSKENIHSIINEIFFVEKCRSENVVISHKYWIEFDGISKEQEEKIREGFIKQINNDKDIDYLLQYFVLTITRARIYIQMEYCQYTLTDLLNFQKDKDRKINAIDLCSIFKQLTSSLITIRNNGILHRDIKPDNIFINIIDGQYKVKIGDFGLATMENKNYINEDNNDINTSNSSKSIIRIKNAHSKGVGTPLYISPEQKDSKDYSYPSDIYSLGLVFFEVIYDYDTFYEKAMNFEKLKKEGKLPKFLSKNIDISIEIKDKIDEIIIGMTEKEAGRRLKHEQILERIEIISSMIPIEAINFNEAVNLNSFKSISAKKIKKKHSNIFLRNQEEHNKSVGLDYLEYDFLNINKYANISLGKIESSFVNLI